MGAVFLTLYGVTACFRSSLFATLARHSLFFDNFGTPKKAQGPDLAPDPLNQAFFSIEITSFLDPENFGFWCLGFWVLGLGFWVWGFWVWGFGAPKKAQGPDLAPDPLNQAFFSIEITSVLDPENFRFWCLGFWVWGSGFGGSGFGVLGLGFWVWGSGFGNSGFGVLGLRFWGPKKGPGSRFGAGPLKTSIF